MSNAYQKLFEDVVERPYLSLKYALRCELYKVCLLSLPFPREDPVTLGRVRTWLQEPTTFHRFRDELQRMIALHGLHINLHAIRLDEWMSHIPTNNLLLYTLYDYFRGGCVELKYDCFKRYDNVLSEWLRARCVDLEYFINR